MFPLGNLNFFKYFLIIWFRNISKRILGTATPGAYNWINWVQTNNKNDLQNYCSRSICSCLSWNRKGNHKITSPKILKFWLWVSQSELMQKMIPQWLSYYNYDDVDLFNIFNEFHGSNLISVFMQLENVNCLSHAWTYLSWYHWQIVTIRL